MSPYQKIVLEKVLIAVTTHYSITLEELLSKTRVPHIWWARSVAVELFRNLTYSMVPDIKVATEFRRDRSNLPHMRKVVREKLRIYPRLAAEYGTLYRSTAAAIDAALGLGQSPVRTSSTSSQITSPSTQSIAA